MTSLADRYLQAVLAQLPATQRVDVGRELRGLIDDLVETRVASGESTESATRSALTELGNPATLAASYHQAPRYLIGPALFPTYTRLLSTYGVVAIAILAALSLGIGIVDGDSVGDLLSQALGTIFDVGVQILLWTTVTFAILERAPDAHAKSFLSFSEWTVDDLPDGVSSRQIGVGETVLAAGTALALAAIAIVQHRQGVGAFVRGQDDKDWISFPVFNPDLGAVIVGTFVGLVALSLAVAITRYVVGSWTTAMLALTLVESVLWVGFIGLLAASEPIFNHDLIEALDSGNTRWEAGGELNMAVLAMVLIISLIDCWDAIKGFRETRVGTSTRAIAAGWSE